MPACWKKVVVWGPVMLGLSMLASGCGPGLGNPSSVSGKVTVDGQPLAGAVVAFHAVTAIPAEYRSLMATTDAAGQYAIAKIYPGTYEVLVSQGGASHAAVDPGMMPAVSTEPLKPTQGEKLQSTVGPEKTTFDIKLTKKGVPSGR